MEHLGIKDQDLENTLDELHKWYNGYLFDEEALERLYNPDMVLFFASEYQLAGGRFPKSLLDTNVSSDYGKIKRVFRLGGAEQQRWELLETLLNEGMIPTQITEEFSFIRGFNQYDFLSLLFYMGLLTIKDAYRSSIRLKIPNDVIRQLYFKYFAEVIERRTGFKAETLKVVEEIEIV